MRQQVKYWSVNPDNGSLLVTEDEPGPNSLFQVRFSRPKFITLRNRKKFAKLDAENFLQFGVSDSVELELLPFVPPKRHPGTA